MQQGGEAPASLEIGTQVSAKYKGAFCEAKVSKVIKQVKCRVTFKQGLGSTTLSDEYVRTDQPLQVGLTVTAKHPDRQEYLDATINKIQDQSQYTVVFDDGDITTLRRNALCIKSGKHYNASESLDNLPLTHPEHFSTPVGGRRRRGLAANSGVDSDAEYDSSSESEENTISTSYLANIGRVVCIENDKKAKTKEAFFPALIVAPAACEAVKIDTKEDLLVRSFKDGRYYTVAKKDTTRFHRDAIKKVENSQLKDAMEKAINYIEKDELPPHWDKDSLFKMGDESTTESSESESIDEDEDEESPEEKDYLVAELYKHMEERGAPINKTPSIANKDVDLYKLFKIVYKLGGHSRVSNNNLWRQVGVKLGFDTTWCINQVRVHYLRYLRTFEDQYRQLGCTLKHHTSGKRTSGANSNRTVIRGKHRSGTGSSKGDSNADGESDKSSISSQEDIAALDKIPNVSEKKKSDVDTKVKEATEELAKPGRRSKGDRSAKDRSVGRQTSGTSKKEESSSKKKDKDKDEPKMTTRPRRDSTSSLAAAMQVKAQKDSIGDESRRPVVRVDRDRETENEAKKLQAKQPKSSAVKEDVATDLGGKKAGNEPPKAPEKTPAEGLNPKGGKKKGGFKKKGEKQNISEAPGEVSPEEKQHLPPHVDVWVGDKVKVFYKQNTIYEAKVIKVDQKANDKWPRYLVHYQGWNARYDEYVKRARIAENLSWSKDRSKDQYVAESVSDGSRKGREKTEASAPVPEKSSTRSKSKTLSSSKSDQATAPARADTPTRTRTGSPALKRQSSRTSVKKESESEEESDDVRKSARLQKTGPSSSASSTQESRRSGRKRQVQKEESENEEIDIEQEFDSKREESPPKKRGRKGGVTPSKSAQEDFSSEEKVSEASSGRSVRSTPSRERVSTRHQQTSKGKDDHHPPTPSSRGGRKGKHRSEDEEEDPYAFKEPEPFDDVKFDASKGKPPPPKKAQGKESAESVVSKEKTDKRKSSTRIKRESDSTDSSSDENVKRTRRGTKHAKTDDKESPTSDPQQPDQHTSEDDIKPEVKMDVPDNALEEGREVETCKIKDEVKEEEEDVKQIKHEVKSEEKTSEEDAGGDEGNSLLQMTKKQRELFPFLSAVRTTTVANMANRTSKPATSESSSGGSDSKSTPPKSKSRSQSPSLSERTYSRQKVNKKRKNPRKPSSSELVESESDSEPVSDDHDASAHPIGSTKSNKGASSSKSEDETPLSTKRKSMSNKKEEVEDMDLACGETIPGSPVHMIDPSDGDSSPSKPEESNSGPLEMPFASVPASVDGPTASSFSATANQTKAGPDMDTNASSVSSTTAKSNPPSTPPVHRTQKKLIEEEEETPECSSASQSPRDIRNDGSKSPADSSEVDMDSLSGRKAESEDSRMDVDNDRPSNGGRGAGYKRRAPNSPAVPSKRKRRTREATLRGGRGGRGRHVSGRLVLGKGGHEEETDESEDHKDSAVIYANLSNEELLALTKRPPKASKYNFFVELEDSMTSSERISKIQNSMEDLKKAYHAVKNDLASVERRRKKLKKKEKERERNEKENTVEPQTNEKET